MKQEISLKGLQCCNHGDGKNNNFGEMCNYYEIDIKQFITNKLKKLEKKKFVVLGYAIINKKGVNACPTLVKWEDIEKVFMEDNNG
jgi:hypothetical protein